MKTVLGRQILRRQVSTKARLSTTASNVPVGALVLLIRPDVPAERLVRSNDGETIAGVSVGRGKVLAAFNVLEYPGASIDLIEFPLHSQHVS